MQDTWSRRLFIVVLVLFSTWLAFSLFFGPELAIHHDELNFLYEALRLPAEQRLSGYGHGPLLYELIAVAESGWYVLLRVTGAVSSPSDFLAH